MDVEVVVDVEVVDGCRRPSCRLRHRIWALTRRRSLTCVGLCVTLGAADSAESSRS